MPWAIVEYRLQVELLKLQAWVKKTGQRVVILFEGRDAAGKGGAIKRFMEHLNPRGARVVALEKPTDVEKGQWYYQRYVEHLPTFVAIFKITGKSDLQTTNRDCRVTSQVAIYVNRYPSQELALKIWSRRRVGLESRSELPFLIRRCGLDSATSSAPFVVTLVDVTGLVIYFTVALVALHGTLL